MEKKNSLTFKIPSTLDKEIEMFCELNEIEDKDELILGCIKGGFAIEKFGRTPVKGGKEIIEKKVEVEVEKEVIKEIEKIIEVPVEKIVEVEKVITDNTKIQEYVEKVNKLTLNNNELLKKLENINHENREFKVQMHNNNIMNESARNLEKENKELKEKIKEYEDVLNHFRRFSGSKTTHLKSSRLDDELYTD
tara:strand:+ start:151 stop:729 length:579 start_codon:yes stop_codon:yes gene_type:complete